MRWSMESDIENKDFFCLFSFKIRKKITIFVVMEKGIKNGIMVRFKEVVEAGDDKVLMLVLDDYGIDDEKCLVQYFCTGIALQPKKEHFKSELTGAKLTPFQRQDIFRESMITAYLNGQIPEPL